MLQNKLKSDVARFTIHAQTCQQPVLVQQIFDESRKTRTLRAENVASARRVQNAQRCFATRFATMLQNNVAKQVACFLFSVFRTLSVADTKGYLVQCT